MPTTICEDDDGRTRPDPKFNGVVRWGRIDLKRVIDDRFGVMHGARLFPDLPPEEFVPASAP